MDAVRENFEKLDFSNSLTPMTKNPGLEDVAAARDMGSDLNEKAATQRTQARKTVDDARHTLYEEGRQEAEAVSHADIEKGTVHNARDVLLEEIGEAWSSISKEGVMFPFPEEMEIPPKKIAFFRQRLFEKTSRPG